MKKQQNIHSLLRITTTKIVVVMFVFFISCKDKNENLVAFAYDAEKIPTIITDTVTTLISDSGITRYKIIADQWLMFERAKEPFWYFPKGIYVERYDTAFKVESTVKADSAWFYINDGIWKLNGDVHLENVKGEQFSSEEFFWNQKEAKIYSDQYIEIKRGPMLIKAIGFRSNQQLTEWDILRPYDSQIPFSSEPPLEAPIDTLQMEQSQ